jgi:hypothetical protein
MITIEEVKKSIYNKIKFLSGRDFMMEEDFNLQIADIKRNYIAAFEECKELLGLTDIDCLTDSISNDELMKMNESFKRYYINTNSSLEKKWSKYEDSPIVFYYLFSQREKEFRSGHRVIWDLIQNAEKYIKSENLSEIKCYFINFQDNSHRITKRICNTENSLTFSGEFDLIIYLISDKRIIKLVIDDKKLISSKENIVQKDLKKIEIGSDVCVFFHYHGLHDPDLLVMDDYESAVDLRRKISDLREMKFNNNKK